MKGMLSTGNYLVYLSRGKAGDDTALFSFTDCLLFPRDEVAESGVCNQDQVKYHSDTNST